ncbi:AmmeMemoRadiSam system protein A [Caldicellulosiruptor sp. F32]|uniref:AmmeMemoRadiSam system protein A n=1 Tax=Caldicellulosiruptor sp. F32 TaxID=1214564 RepID=UPI0003A825DB|nr:AmmeMemoRadiSam system protein A [Caldicellulosiruptor sp. F32]
MVGYLLPHPPILIDKIGNGEEKKCQATLEALEKVTDEILEYKPDVVVVISPHAPIFSDVFFLNDKPTIEGSLTRWGVRGVEFKFHNNLKIVEDIAKMSKEEGLSVGFVTDKIERRYGISRELDHGAMVPLYFVTKKYRDFELIHTAYCMVDDIKLYRYGMIIRKALEKHGKRSLIIASGDLSHKLKEDGPYGFAKEGVEFDKLLVDLLQKSDIKGLYDIEPEFSERAAECGFRSIKVLIGAFDGYEIESKVYSYEGPFGVGYCVAGFYQKGTTTSLLDEIAIKKEQRLKKIRENEDEYIRLARESLEYYVRHRRYLDHIPDYVTERMLKERAGVFVSIKKDGNLRGCIGTIYPTQENIAKEIIRNAVAAGFHDPRFEEVTEEELDSLVYDVDILSTPEKVTSISELDPKKYGVIVRKGARQGLLLPDLEGVDTVEEQLKIACRKAGIDYDREDFEIERFTVERHK